MIPLWLRLVGADKFLQVDTTLRYLGTSSNL